MTTVRDLEKMHNIQGSYVCKADIALSPEFDVKIWKTMLATDVVTGIHSPSPNGTVTCGASFVFGDATGTLENVARNGALNYQGRNALRVIQEHAFRDPSACKNLAKAVTRPRRAHLSRRKKSQGDRYYAIVTPFRVTVSMHRSKLAKDMRVLMVSSMPAGSQSTHSFTSGTVAMK